MTEKRDSAVVPVRMRENMLLVIDNYAAKEGRSRSDLIRRLLAEAIEARRATRR